jgi:hypothetical protein
MDRSTVSRLVLVGAPRTRRDEPIRRYRLARVRLDDGARPLRDHMPADASTAARHARHAHLGRSYD